MRRLPWVLAALIGVVGVVAYLLSRAEPADAIDVPETARSRPSAEPSTPLEGAPVATPVARTTVAAAEKPGGVPDSYKAALGTLIGRILEHDGTPKSGMKVDLVGCNPLELFPAQDVARFADDVPALNVDAGSTRTDADGRFRLESVDPRGFYLLAVDRAGPRATAVPVLALPQAGQTIDLGDIQLGAFCTLRGIIVDERGEPVTDARVRASGDVGEAFPFGLAKLRDGCALTGQLPPEAEAVFPGLDGWPVIDVPPIALRMWELIPIPETRTAKDGSFVLEGVALGRVWIAVDQPGYVQLVRGPIPTANGGEKDIGKQTLHVGDELPIVVLDGADEPVAGAEVLVAELLPIYPAGLAVPIGETDANGRIVATGLTQGRHVVAVRPKDATRWIVSEVVYPGVDEPEIRVESTFALRARVLAKDGTQPAGAKLAVIPESPLAEVPFLDSKVRLKGRTTKLDDGRIEVRGLSPGSYHVLAVADGHAVGRTTARIDKGLAEVELVLEPEHSATIRVIADKDGAPIEWALASVTTPNEEKMMELFQPPTITRRTDANGVAFLPHLPEGKQRLRVFHPFYAIEEFEMAVPGPPVEVRLKAGGTLRGHVTQNGEPITKAHMVVAFPSSDDATILPRLTLTDEHGDFTITHLEAGPHKVVATEKPLSGMGGSGMGGPMIGMTTTTRVNTGESDDDDADGGGVRVNVGGNSGFDAGPPEVEVVIREGEETWVDLDTKRAAYTGKTARVRGVVLVNGAPRAEMLVEARGSRGGGDQARTDAQGRFDLAAVPAGDATVTARSGTNASAAFAVLPLQLTQGETREVQLVIETGSLSGRVRAASNGDAIGFANVSLMGGDATIPAATEQDGTFAFQDVPQGDYLVRVQHGGYATTDVGPIHVPGRGAATPLSIELLSAVTVSGTVELPSGVTAPYLFVRLVKKGAKDDEDGGIGLGSFGFVDPTSRSFEIADVAPGAYDVFVLGTEADLAPVDVNVPVTGLNGVSLRPTLK